MMIVHFKGHLRKAVNINPLILWRAAMTLRPSITYALPRSCISQTIYQGKLYKHHQRRSLSFIKRVYRPWSPDEIVDVVAREQRRIHDPESIISEEQREKLEKISRNSTRYDAAVVIIPKMHPTFVISADRDIDTAAKMFARRVRELWGIDREYENCVILFLFIEDP